MKCEVCKKDVREVTLFRDEKDGVVIWRCEKCLPSSSARGIVKAIQGDNK